VAFEGDGTPKNEPRDPEVYARALAARIGELAADPERARRFGEAGRQRVIDRFSWRAIADRTAELYESLARR
jgi:starch synthase